MSYQDLYKRWKDSSTIDPEIREELEPIQKAMQNINERMSAYIQRLTRENKKRENIR